MVSHLVEEYVKDLYRIGMILFFTPVALMLLGIASGILGHPIDNYNEMIGPNALVLAGFLIMLYLSIKYYYKEGRYGKS